MPPTLKTAAAISLFVFFSSAALSGQLEVDFEPVAGGFSRPTFITHAGDGSGRLFVTEQHGRILIVDPQAGVLPTPFLDLSSSGLNRVSQDGGYTERGLLGMAFHPEYAAPGAPGQGIFYVHYTLRSDGASIVSQFSVSANPNVANTAEYGSKKSMTAKKNAALLSARS